MLLDLHTHTRYSPDSRISPADLVALARRIGLAGIAITDHNSVEGIREAELDFDKRHFLGREAEEFRRATDSPSLGLQSSPLRFTHGGAIGIVKTRHRRPQPRRPKEAT